MCDSCKAVSRAFSGNFIVAVILCLILSTASGGVYDDVKYWFRGCYNGLIDVNTRLDNYEFPNALNIGVAANPSGDSFSINGSRANMQIETVDVLAPYAGLKLRDRQTLHFTQSLTDNGNGGLSTNSTSIQLVGPFQFKKNSSFSVGLRIKREKSAVPESTWCSVFSSDYSWSGNCGFRIAFTDVDFDSYNVQIWMGSSQKKHIVTFPSRSGNGLISRLPYTGRRIPATEAIPQCMRFLRAV